MSSSSVRILPPELASVAKKELNEEPNRIAADIQNIKDWISKQPHLLARTDDQWLVAVLRGCKFSLERVKKKIDLFYTVRNTAPDLVRRISPTDPKFLEVLRLGVIVILPKSKDILSPRVVLIRPGMYDPSKYNIFDIMCIFYYLLLIFIMDDDTATVVGVKSMIDYTGISLAHLAQSSPAAIKKMIVVLQDSVPLRLKGNHHIKPPSIVETALTLIKSMINEKARQRMVIHKSEEDLHNHFPKDIIPNEFGGSAGTAAEIIEYWVKKIDEYKQFLVQEERFGTDESRRAGKPVTAEEMFGIEGSFRKLDLD